MNNSNSDTKVSKSNNSKIVFLLFGLLIVLIAVLIFSFFKSNSKQISSNDTVKTDNMNKTATQEVTNTNSDNQLKQRELDLKEQELKLKEKEIDQKNKMESSKEFSQSNEKSWYPGRYPQASERYLSAADVQYMSKAELELMRNEIFARHGYIFTKNDKMIKYFSSQSWYNPLYYDVNNMLSKIEKENIALIKIYER